MSWISSLRERHAGEPASRWVGIAVVLLVAASNEPKAGRPLAKSRPVSKSVPTSLTVLALSELRALAGTAIPDLHKKKLNLRPFPRYTAFTSGNYYKVHSLSLQWFGD